ncbi:polyprenyl synthetase family protein [Amycolatopsis sp. NPDC054798]
MAVENATGETEPAGPPPLPDVNHRARDYTREGLEDVLDGLHPDAARICRYYFGWCEADGSPAQRRGSRTLQATMVMLAAEAAGADPLLAKPGAVAMELAHNFTCLHDDIADGDDVRRDRPTAWVAFGTGPALVAGDALLNEAVRTLASVPGPAALTAITVFTDGIANLIRAWFGEPAFDRARPQDVALDDYLSVCEGKGGALLGTAATLGTVLAGKPPEDADGLRQAAHYAGIAWQAVNDLENIWGDAALVGKPGFQDLRTRKNTLPVIAATQSGHPETGRLVELLEQPARSEADLTRIAELLDICGGRSAAESTAREYLERAQSTLDDIGLPAKIHHDLSGLMHFAVTRKVRPSAR